MPSEYESAFLDHLPDWAVRAAKTDGIEAMQQLCTKDGRLHGNATVISVKVRQTNPLDLSIAVVTDAGSIIEKYCLSEVLSGFYLGNYIMKDYPTTEAREAVEKHRLGWA